MFLDQLNEVKVSCSKDDLIFAHLQRHLSLLADVIEQGTPKVKQVTSRRTVCEAMIYKTKLSVVHILLGLYFTIRTSSATSERTFSALKHVFTY